MVKILEKPDPVCVKRPYIPLLLWPYKKAYYYSNISYFTVISLLKTKVFILPGFDIFMDFTEGEEVEFDPLFIDSLKNPTLVRLKKYIN